MAYDPTDFNSVELKISHFARDKDNHPAHYNICSDLRVFLSIKIGEVETLKRNGAPTEAEPHLINVKYIPTRSAFVVTAPTTYSDTIFQAGAFDFEAYRLVCKEHDISRVQGRRIVTDRKGKFTVSEGWTPGIDEVERIANAALSDVCIHITRIWQYKDNVGLPVPEFGCELGG